MLWNDLTFHNINVTNKFSYTLRIKIKTLIYGFYCIFSRNILSMWYFLTKISIFIYKSDFPCNSKVLHIFTSLCVFCLPYEYYITSYANKSQQQIENILDSFLKLYKPHLGVFHINLNTFTLMGVKCLYGACVSLFKRIWFFVLCLNICINLFVFFCFFYFLFFL